MNKVTLYTFGYLSSKAERTLQELIAVKIPVVDIRYSPNAKQWRWTQGALKGQTGIIYYWLQNLGNENYKSALTGAYQEPHIKLHDPERGLIELENILEKHGGQASLMCACSSKKTCHRILVAQMVQERFEGLQVKHL